MKMAAKSGARAKTAAKPAKKRPTTATKPVKKRPAAAKPVKKASDEFKPTAVPLAEVEVLAAKAVKMIKASTELSAMRKKKRLASVAETLEHARRMGALSKCGASWLTEMHIPPEPYDIRQIRRLLER